MYDRNPLPQAVQMAPTTYEPKAVELFLSYSHKDDALRDKLASHLKLLERQGLVRSWHDRKIDAGNEWKDQIDSHLNSAAIILLLISPDFLASDYCFDVEMKRALQRHEDASATVIPIILRPVDWKQAPFAKLQALPTNAKPITTFANRDVAFEEVAAGIRAAIEGDKRNRSASKPALAPEVSSIANATTKGDCTVTGRNVVQPGLTVPFLASEVYRADALAAERVTERQVGERFNRCPLLPNVLAPSPASRRAKSTCCPNTWQKP